MKRKWKWFALITLFASPVAMAGTIYKCKNPAGTFQYQEKPCDKEAQPVSSWASTSGVETDAEGAPADRVLVIGQGQGGHYFIDGSVNDSYLNFVIDTGATTVALPLSVAARAGVECRKKTLMNTGNGVTQGCAVTIAKLKFGHFTMRHVDAVVMPNLNQPLLGMNVLRQFRIEQDNGEMRLSKKY